MGAYESRNWVRRRQRRVAVGSLLSLWRERNEEEKNAQPFQTMRRHAITQDLRRAPRKSVNARTKRGGSGIGPSDASPQATLRTHQKGSRHSCKQFSLQLVDQVEKEYCDNIPESHHIAQDALEDRCHCRKAHDRRNW